MKPIIGNGERIFMYALAGLVDVLQFIFDLFVVTEVFNHFIDIIFGAFLLFYAVQRKILDSNKGLTLLAVFAGEQIPFVNALPFWTFDVYNLYKGIPSEEQKPEKQGGITPPRLQRKPLNAQPGIRPPRQS